MYRPTIDRGIYFNQYYAKVLSSKQQRDIKKMVVSGEKKEPCLHRGSNHERSAQESYTECTVLTGRYVVAARSVA